MSSYKQPISIVQNRDCMEAMAEFPDKFFELAIVDPPYGIGMDWKKRKHVSGKYANTSYKNIGTPQKDYFEQLFRVSNNQIIWGANYYSNFLPPTNNLLIWDKRSNCEKEFNSEGELAWTSFTKWPFRIGTFEWSGGRKGNETGVEKIHPHQKPIALYKWLLQNYAKPGDKILDTHLGSGSSRIAAYDMGFDFWGYELDADYFEAMEKRFKTHISKPTLFAHEQMYDFEQGKLFEQ